MRILAIVLSILALAAPSTAQEFEPALEHARELAREHNYNDVLEVLTPFEDLEGSEAQYVLAAEIGRAHYHLGDYEAANQAFRRAVGLRPQRVETALYLQATSYLLGDHAQAYAIFREILKSDATDLFLAVTLPGERTFLADPAVWEILDELATVVDVDVDRGSLLGVTIGDPRAEVERTLGVGSSSPGETLTARAGPHLTWAFGFDEHEILSQIMLHNDNLVRYTPYRLELSNNLDWRSAPAAATSALGAPESTSTSGVEVVVMVWRRGDLRLTLEFAHPRPPVPLKFEPDNLVLRVIRMEAVEPEAEAETTQP